WDADEVRRNVPADSFEAFARRFGLNRPANFEDRWHLHAHRSVEDVANELGLSEAEASQHIDRARASLLEARNARVRPGRDEKVLSAWNGLAIGALSIAARALRRPDLAEAATRAIDFVRAHLWHDGRLLAVH